MSTSPKAPDLTRQKLLEAAFAEIHRNGFQSASLTQILADTGLTKGALYHHFPDKRALGLSVIEEVIRPRLAAMMFAPLADTHAPLAALQALLADKAAEDDPMVVTLGCPLNNLMQEMSPVDEGFRLRLNGVFEAWVGVVAAALARGRTAGEVRSDVDPDATAFFIVSALEGCVGMSKNTQSVAAYRGCLAQLGGFLDTLRAS
ncbi:TetR family transcriptional regulator C-terminal domain-containing protein [Thiobacillus sedimenti]|uniref:TetR family transcriptional regulator C-terminal domain-containing protein n=1 Tax=Thiobacillus sedimenti TaxID=3110231 RepID=A0ABZ1CLP8_9PROT|nr:TetR family transcriptional regulator C-terminal domain-containing protein [Thiobacillus sp. SCUT-2]WRS39806.1 TetR family transcriptional regulator C-terminal domain-containing protein [Thiobacillus sp. SCUT-2]